MRRLSIGMHAIVVLISLSAVVGLWYMFARYGAGSYWEGTLRARVYGYSVMGVALVIGTVWGVSLFLLSLGRLLQLLFPGLPLIGRWQGLRSAANVCLVIVLVGLVAELPEFDVVANPVRGFAQRIFPGLGPSDGAAKKALRPDRDLTFPALPYVQEKDPLAAVAFTSLEGETVTLGALRGKTVFLNVWATWCGPCRMEMPNLEALWESVKDDPEVVFILAADNEKAEVTKFLQDNPHKAPVYLLDEPAKKKLKITAFPTTMILSKEGEVVFKQLGSAAWDGGTTREFLLALAHDKPFTPPNGDRDASEQH